MPKAPQAKPLSADTRKAAMLAKFSSDAVEIAIMVERDYGVQLDDHKHRQLVADIQAILAPPAAEDYTLTNLVEFPGEDDIEQAAGRGDLDVSTVTYPVYPQIADGGVFLPFEPEYSPRPQLIRL